MLAAETLTQLSNQMVVDCIFLVVLIWVCTVAIIIACGRR
jgi:hypothetical protein